MTQATGISAPPLGAAPVLADFWSMGEAEREEMLLHGIAAAHTYHFERNTAYRNTVAARGVGPWVRPEELPWLLRATSQAFKSYADILGTPFPQDRPAGFVEWLADQVSVDLRPHEHKFHARYWSLERLLKAVERAYSRPSLELHTSSGTSGRAAVIPRDQASTDLAAESFRLSLERYLGMNSDYTAIFMVPNRSRIAPARMVRYGLRRVGLTPDRVHCTVRFLAYPDQVRVLTGRTYRAGWRGVIEKRVWHPAITLIQKRLVDAQAVESAISLIVPAAAHGEKIILFGSLTQLHNIASFLLDAGRTVALPSGSLLGTSGGMRTTYGKGQAEIRQDLQSAFRLRDGGPVPIRDVYGMAEANWGAMQCSQGSYHIPPWVHAVTLDDDEAFQRGTRTTGVLAFFDPYGGGGLFPAFFRTPDRVTLVRGTACPCEESGSYLEETSIQRIDPLGESRCGGHA